MIISDVFSLIERKMRSDLEEIRASLKHAPSIGASSESIVRDFFRSHIPQNLGISSGFIIDSLGNKSKQLDIIIYDAAKTPILFERDNIRVIPVECIYFVVEVKTKLDKDSLKSCVENMLSVKNIYKRAHYDEGAIRRPVKAYGREYEDWPVMYFVFSFESIEIERIAYTLNILNNEAPIDKTIDSIFTLDKGLISNYDGNVFDALPFPGSKLACISNDSLFLFYTIFSQYFNQVYMRNFRFIDYAMKANWSLKIIE